jgi:hypothetical protein
MVSGISKFNKVIILHSCLKSVGILPRAVILWLDLFFAGVNIMGIIKYSWWRRCGRAFLRFVKHLYNFCKTVNLSRNLLHPHYHRPRPTWKRCIIVSLCVLAALLSPVTEVLTLSWTVVLSRRYVSLHVHSFSFLLSIIPWLSSEAPRRKRHKHR